jgi:hypothetical protein
LKIIIYLVAILLTVSLAAKAIGSLQPPNPALRGFVEGCEDKPQPCWYGIVPGQTVTAQVVTTINALRHVPCDITLIQSSHMNRILSIELQKCHNFQLADLVLEFDSKMPTGTKISGVIIGREVNALFWDVQGLSIAMP